MRVTGRLSFRRRARRGMALALTMLILLAVMVILTLGMIGTPGGGASRGGNNGLMFTANNSLQQAGARMQSGAAFNMAEAGVQYTMQWLNSLPGPPSLPSPAVLPAFGPGFVWNTFTYTAAATTVTPDPGSPGNTFTVTVYPDSNNPQNAQKKYLIESTGVSGGMSQTVQVYVEVSSLSKWLVLVDTWPSDNYWVSGLSSFDGPVHDNNSDGVPENVFWTPNVTAPMWTYGGDDAYQLSGSVNWVPGPPQTASDWGKILVGGQETYTSGAATVPFPPSSVIQRDAALGVSPDSPIPPVIPTATGVTVTPGGGIYIHCAQSQNDSTGAVPTPNNDVQQMTLSVDAGGNQVITVLQNDDAGHPMTTTVTLNAASRTTQVSVSQQPAAGGAPVVTTSSVAGLGNGVVYTDGNIGTQGSAPGDPKNGTPKTGGLSGVIADKAYDASGKLLPPGGLTIATASTKNCNIDGDLVYKTARRKDASGNYLPEDQDPNFLAHAGTLGVVSNTVLLTTTDAGGSAKNNYEVDGSVLAYTLYEVDQYLTRPTGNWENMGGYLSKRMGYFGTFDNNSGALTHGMNNSFNYDSRLRDTPPPFFPTTSNQYDQLSWRRVAGTIE